MDKEMRRILLVDDDRLVLATLASGIEASGYTVAKADSGEKALAMVESFNPHLAVMDICLPGITGIETARRIRAQSDIPVIFLSAYDDPDAVRESITLGGMTYLMKPISVKQLVPAIENAIARAKDIRTLISSEENLTAALKQNRETSIAIGLLMERHQLSAEAAFDLLRTHARNTRTKTSEVANALLAGTLKL